MNRIGGDGYGGYGGLGNPYTGNPYQNAYGGLGGGNLYPNPYAFSGMGGGMGGGPSFFPVNQAKHSNQGQTSSSSLC